MTTAACAAVVGDAAGAFVTLGGGLAGGGCCAASPKDRTALSSTAPIDVFFIIKDRNRHQVTQPGRKSISITRTTQKKYYERAEQSLRVWLIAHRVHTTATLLLPPLPKMCYNCAGI